MSSIDLAIEHIDQTLDPDREPLDDRALRCIISENRGSERDRRLFISARCAGVRV